MHSPIHIHRPHYELDLTAQPRRPSWLVRFSQWLTGQPSSQQALRRELRLASFEAYIH
ncbi:hypothetical protein J2X19_002806 [Rhodoferax ferrireducens]|uniref:Uncharacterized protein n=1 Tax=Rhodoferax ferrireducens TaxID=192843 RepID=A0ABU2C9V9_9BURK|nr:hypothetical protein [Rhodoferax ferrireducens]MDR7378127.1 hypothetical protein [Rhodoferax ferrireducens]